MEELECKGCERGFYQSNWNQLICLQCPPGYNTTTTNAMQCGKTQAFKLYSYGIKNYPLDLLIYLRLLNMCRFQVWLNFGHFHHFCMPCLSFQ